MAIYARDAGVWKNVTGGESTVGNANFTDTPTGTYSSGKWCRTINILTFTGTGSVTI